MHSWMIQQIWTKRNTYLHQSRQSVQSQQEAQLNDEITFEYGKGATNLSSMHRAMFSIPLTRLLECWVPHRINWLCGVWVTRENKDTVYLSKISVANPNPTLRFKYVKWKSKILYKNRQTNKYKSPLIGRTFQTFITSPQMESQSRHSCHIQYV